MMSFKKVAGINIAILLIYTLLTNVASGSGPERGLGVVIILALLISLHTFINFVLCLVYFSTRNKVAGRNFLLSALVVLVIGFSTCLGTASLY